MPTSMKEQVHRIAVLHEWTNLGISAAPIYDTQQSEEGAESREVGESECKPAYPSYCLQELQQAILNPSGQQEQSQRQLVRQDTQHSAYKHNVTLASMESLWSPSARSDQATVLRGVDPPPPDYQSPTNGKLSPTCKEMAVRGGKTPGPGKPI